MTENMKMERDEYAIIDVVKFVCAVLVMSIHIAPFGTASSVSIWNFGIQQFVARIAVPFFFTATGFLLSVNQENHRKTYRKHIIKSLKLYCIWTVLYFPLVASDIFNHSKGIIYGLAVYLRNVLLVGSYSHLWYLQGTIVALLILLLLERLKVKHKYVFIIASLLYVLGVLSQTWFGLLAPIKNITLTVWNVLKCCQKVFVTARNGVFEGLLFICLGNVIAKRHEKNRTLNVATRKRLNCGLVVSVMLFFAETYYVTKYGLARERDLYFSLVPVTYFLVRVLLYINLKGRKYYEMRVLSSLMYFSHLWINKIVVVSLSEVCGDKYSIIEGTPLRFIIVVCVTILFSLLIRKVSKMQGLGWLKNLYS